MQFSPVKILLVDDEVEVTTAISWLLDSMKLDVSAYNSVDDFIDYLGEFTDPACLVLDLMMPGRSGLEVFDTVMAMRPDIPVIFLSAHGDIASVVHSMKSGAIDFLQKPFDPQNFLDVINRGIRVAGERYRSRRNIESINGVLAGLSSRERQVLTHTLSGNSAKEVANILGISYKTVEVHRANILRKIDVSTFRELAGKLREERQCGKMKMGWPCRSVCLAGQTASLQ